MNINNKLRTFQKIIEGDITARNSAVISDVKEKYSEACAEIKKNAVEGAEKFYRNECLKAELNKNKDILKASAESKKALVELRDRHTDSLFEKVSSRIAGFTKSHGYPDYLANIINEIKNNNNGKTEASEVILRPEDMVHAGHISSACSLTVTSGTEDFAGGFYLKFKNGNAVLDMTFKTKLLNARKNFQTVNLSGDGE